MHSTSQYGKPILDRLLHPGLSLEVGGQIALTPVECTARSNVTVGPPYEVSLNPQDSLAFSHHVRFEEDAPYLVNLRQVWNQELQTAVEVLPQFDREVGGT